MPGDPSTPPPCPQPPLPTDDEARHGTRSWPHAPPHRLAESGVYFVTARCAEKRHLLQTPALRDFFQTSLLSLAEKFGWRLEAWAILSNHYHLIAHSPSGGGESLGLFLRQLHAAATREVNRHDATPGRTRLWHNYRETRLTLPRAYLARLNYVHNNPVHHRLVPRAVQWPWCSAAAFEHAVTPAWARTIESFRYDQIAAQDQDDD